MASSAVLSWPPGVPKKPGQGGEEDKNRNQAYFMSLALKGHSIIPPDDLG
jgi:hypothetical protein